MTALDALAARRSDVPVLHGVVDRSGLVLGGESFEDARPARRKGGTRRGKAASAHPYDRGAEIPAAALREAGLELGGANREAVTLGLPTQNGRPMASGPMIDHSRVVRLSE